MTPETRHVDIIERNVEKAHLWLNDLADELETDDCQAAYRVLRAFLHAVRDRLTVDEAAQLAAQLPELIRGIYYEGWVPSRTPLRYRSKDDFLRRIATEALLAGETEASYAATAAARVLHRHVSEGELEDVLGMLPKGLRAVVAG
jgi:uncharacterized protein (DUF2267 family)